MVDFTYEIPNENIFMKAILAQLRLEYMEPIANLLKGATCEISHSAQFSNKRWNGFWTTVTIFIPLQTYENVYNFFKDSPFMVKICNEIMPINAGLDVMEVRFSPSLEETPMEKSMMDDLEKSIEILSKEIIEQIISDDIKLKGRDMADAYVYLYCVENALRTFIDKIFNEKYGDEYFSNITLNREIEDKIKIRKRDERVNLWLPLRGDSEIFYLDFDDLAKLIINNWEVFKNYFPTQSWITTKIQELSKCRNLVAHNSYIGKNERDLIRVYFNSILTQLGSVLS